MCPKSYWTNNSKKDHSTSTMWGNGKATSSNKMLFSVCFYSDWLRMKKLWIYCWGQSLVWSNWSLRGDNSNWLPNSTNSSDSQTTSTTPCTCSQKCSDSWHNKMCWILQNSRKRKLSSPGQRNKRRSQNNKKDLSNLMSQRRCLEYLSRNIIIYFNDF